MRPFRSTGGGSVAVTFTALESTLIADLAGQVADLLDGKPSVSSGVGTDDALLASVGIGGGAALPADPAIARLLPDAYGDDSDASAEFRRLTEHSLSGRKISNARLVVAALPATGTAKRDTPNRGTPNRGTSLELDPAAQQAWLRTLTDIRLVIATRLGIEKDDDRGHDDSESSLVMGEIYDWLAMVQDSLLEAMES